MAFRGMNDYNEQRRRTPSIDFYTDTNRVITYEHHEVHEGSMFHVFTWFELAQNGYLDIRITVADSAKWPNFTFDVGTEAESTIALIEGVSITNPGTQLTPINSNRNSEKASLTQFDYILNADLASANADTDITGGLVITAGKTGSGRSAGGSDNRANEIILKQNTVYTLRVQNNDNTASRWVDTEFLWYEHANKL